MNSITLIGQIQGDAKLIDRSKDKAVEFYEFVLKISRDNPIKGEPQSDYFLIKHIFEPLKQKFGLYDKRQL
ncbi:hypothetical protein [Mycoplasma capricolum]|uniref:hypothetical protein n=1 Tax=Mycoplasma capricolum TaxID=2095 RepID=UPI0022F3CE5B|nr:hypothetical protein [Mycoplasma capricolum]WBX36454.1 hypothetical protein NO343_01165 [Mycoplasma capricolum subsp. capricolum]